jgi:hypothetical protein
MVIFHNAQVVNFNHWYWMSCPDPGAIFSFLKNQSVMAAGALLNLGQRRGLSSTMGRGGTFLACPFGGGAIPKWGTGFTGFKGEKSA